MKVSEETSTVKASGVGNNVLTYPIGLITIDEAAYAGGKNSLINPKYYLWTGTAYWTMSPYDFSSYSVNGLAWIIDNSGNWIVYTSILGIRPVINLKPDVLYASGIGTENDPYIITIK